MISFVSGSHSGHHLVFNHHVSLGSSGLRWFLRLVFDDYDSSAEHWSGILQKAPQLGFVWCSSHDWTGEYVFGGGRSQRERVVLLTSEWGHVLSSRPTVVEVSLDHCWGTACGVSLLLCTILCRGKSLCSPHCKGWEVMPHLHEGRVCA